MTASERAAEQWAAPPLPTTFEEAQLAFIRGLFGVGPQPHSLDELDVHRRSFPEWENRETT